MHDTYTFVAEYKGGTYIRQINALSVGEACVLWARAIVQHSDIPIKNAPVFEDELRYDLMETPPACVEGAPNVWYFMADAGKGFIHVNVVKTHLEVSEWQFQKKDITLAITGGAHSMR